MFRSLQSASSGLKAQELIIDTISNNLANVNTHGFKKSSINFQDLMYQSLKNISVEETGDAVPVGLEIGYGTKPVNTVKDFSQGTLIATKKPLDCAINGTGFFRVLKPNGKIVYSRDGAFQISSNGNLVTANGYIVMPDIIFPQDAENISISKDGIVTITYPNDPTPEELGQIELSRFVNTAGLRSIGDNLYEATPSSGNEIIGYSTDEGFGEIVQGYLEGSNVSIVEEMMKMIVAQRAYEILSKAVKTSEEMMSIANNMK
ncbi:MAG: flagellar basal-body rod protein FlgG [Candidatus Cloacimonetes bacterium]|nr:flagellar basal-body rod protein FlgG [Candidatus Cloacimonadota bacterium]